MINYRRYINVVIDYHFFINILCSFFPNLSFFYSYLILIFQVITFFYCTRLSNYRILLNKIERNVYYFIMLLQIIAYICSNVFFDYTCFDLHRLCGFILMFYTSFSLAKKAYFTKNDLYNLLNKLLFLGYFSVFYNLVKNLKHLIPFNLSNVMYYTTNFKSFFSTRSNFGLLLCICFVISFFYCKIRQRFFDKVSLFVFGFNIFLINARTSILAILMVLIYELIKAKKTRKNLTIFTLFFSCIIIFVFVFFDEILTFFNLFIDKFSLLIFHGNDKSDFSNGRFDLLRYAILGTNSISFIIGHGIGSKDAYLSSIGSSILSFHNGYVDLFFEGGIVLLFIFMYVIKSVTKKLKVNTLISVHERKLFMDFVILLLCCELGDAITTPFLLDTSVLLSTILFITVPIAYCNR